MGDSVGTIRIFRVRESNVERLYEIEGHKVCNKKYNKNFLEKR